MVIKGPGWYACLIISYTYFGHVLHTMYRGAFINSARLDDLIIALGSLMPPASSAAGGLLSSSQSSQATRITNPSRGRK
ncbi:hypothetical protein F4824DRAFT_452081 [Ustulina deusta]|nr:hypothetical protein F4824DRAFT_452081 [Ustulina deusta]